MKDEAAMAVAVDAAAGYGDCDSHTLNGRWSGGLRQQLNLAAGTSRLEEVTAATCLREEGTSTPFRRSPRETVYTERCNIEKKDGGNYTAFVAVLAIAS